MEGRAIRRAEVPRLEERRWKMRGGRRGEEAADLWELEELEAEPDWPVFQPAGGLNSLGLEGFKMLVSFVSKVAICRR